MDIKKFKEKAKEVRLSVFDSSVTAGKGHLGGTFSCADLLVALYYGGILKFDSQKTNAPDRDRFILSKGHACLAVYAIFKDLGIISKQTYDSYGRDGGLGGQLDIAMPGIDFNTGSLGHAIGVAAGMALAARLSGENFRAFTLVGDAELFEGAMWEAIIFASENRINNLIVIIDRNRLSVTASLEDDGVFANFERKMADFGWDYEEINGHDFGEIFEVFDKIKNSKKPVMIVANTVKGKGVSFMENNAQWHHGVPDKSQIEIARKELTS